MANTHYTQLPVWQKAERLSTQIFDMAPHFMSGGHYALMSQIQRAALNVTSSISEGWASGSNKTFSSYTDIAKAGLSEVDAALFMANRAEAISDKMLQDLMIQVSEISGLLTALRSDLLEAEAAGAMTTRTRELETA